MAGLSVRTIFVNCFCQFFIFLYLLDNDTSWMIVMSSGVGMLIEFWKIKQAVDIKIDTSGRIPRISFTDKVGRLLFVLFPFNCYFVGSIDDDVIGNVLFFRSSIL